MIHSLDDKDITLTPLELIAALGVFDLDPCGISFHKTAANIISLPIDGLSIKWNGRVWLNPPYSSPTPWLKKLAEHGNGIALVLNSTDTKWFHEYGLSCADSLFLIKKRPKFMRLDGTRVSIMRGVVLFAYGKENSDILASSTLDGHHVWLKR